MVPTCSLNVFTTVSLYSPHSVNAQPMKRKYSDNHHSAAIKRKFLRDDNHNVWASWSGMWCTTATETHSSTTLNRVS
jgi:hypothetical protein